jgi:hypothetical protein
MFVETLEARIYVSMVARALGYGIDGGSIPDS